MDKVQKYIFIGLLVVVVGVAAYVFISRESRKNRAQKAAQKAKDMADELGLDLGEVERDAVDLYVAMDEYWNAWLWGLGNTIDDWFGGVFGADNEAVVEIVQRYDNDGFDVLAEVYLSEYKRSLVKDIKGLLDTEDLRRIEYIIA